MDHSRTIHAQIVGSSLSGREKLSAIFATTKAFAGISMLFVVIAGALGYNETIQLAAAAAGLCVALGMKKARIIA